MQNASPTSSGSITLSMRVSDFDNEITSPSQSARMRLAVPRHDLYAGPHKGVRSVLSEALVAVGKLDVDDPVACARSILRVTDAINLLRHHMAIEDRVLLPAIEQRKAGATSGNAREHIEHAEALTAIEDLAVALQAAVSNGAPDRTHRGHALYLAFGALVADDLTHMAAEEQYMNPILWALFTDEELIAIGATIQAQLSMEELAASVRWMLPVLNPQERAEIVRNAKRMLPPDAFATMYDILANLLSARDRNKLDDALADKLV